MMIAGELRGSNPKPPRRRLDAGAYKGFAPTLQAPGKARESHGASPAEEHTARHAEEHRASIGSEADMTTHEIDTRLQYVAYVRKEGRRHLIEFPDAPGCQTFAAREADIYPTAKEAIEGWIEAHLVEGMDLPLMHRPPKANERCVHITISPKLVLASQFRSLRSAPGWSQAEI